jgi:transposase
VVEGRSSRDLAAFLMRLKGRERVRVVCIDLSSPYRKLIRRFFPNARIVADRFHVVRIVQHHFLELFRAIAPQIKANRGSLAALRKRPDRLKERQRQRLAELFARHPALEAAYQRMQKLLRLLTVRHRKARQCRPLARQLLAQIQELHATGLCSLVTLAKTLQSWSEGDVPVIVKTAVGRAKDLGSRVGGC